MPHTSIPHPDRASDRVHRGAHALAEACRPTLGPHAHPVLLRRRSGHPLISDDGATIRAELDLEDPVEKLGAQVLKEAADRTADTVGDGTTTAGLLTFELFSGGLEHLAAGASAPKLKEGMQRALQRTVEVLEHLSTPVETLERKEQVATVAAGNDPAVGRLVAEAFDRVGPDGTVTVQPGSAGPAQGTGVETVGGTRFSGGYLSPYFVTDPEGRKAVQGQPRLLLCSGTLESMTPLLPVMERVAREGRPLVLVARKVSEDVLATLVVHELRGTLSCLAVRGPEDGHDQERAGVLEDLAVLTGARVVERDVTPYSEAPRLDDLGEAELVVATQHRTEVVGGQGSPEAIELRCKDLRRNAALAGSPEERRSLQDRLSTLSGGMAVLRVERGSPSQGSANGRNPRWDVFQRAIGGTRAALEEGVVPGGGAALLRAVPALEHEAERSHGDEEAGVRLLRRALDLPARQIAENAGMDGAAVVGRMAAGSAGMGFDAVRKEYRDLLEAGIVDPTKVVRVALENAVAVAGTLLSANATLTEERRLAKPGGIDAAVDGGMPQSRRSRGITKRAGDTAAS